MNAHRLHMYYRVINHAVCPRTDPELSRPPPQSFSFKAEIISCLAQDPLESMNLLSLVLTLLLSLPSILASELLLLDPYKRPLVYYYYTCGCFKVAMNHASRYDSRDVFERVLQPTTDLCFNVIWSGHTALVHEAARLLPPFFAFAKGSEIWDFVTPQDGFVLHSPFVASTPPRFIFFGSQRTSNLDLMRKLKFPGVKETLAFHSQLISYFVFKATIMDMTSNDRVLLSVKSGSGKLSKTNLGNVQRTIITGSAWRKFINTTSTEKFLKFIQKLIPGSLVHFGYTDGEHQRIKILFHPLSLIPPQTIFAIKYLPTQFAIPTTWASARHACILAANVKGNDGICTFFIAFEFDALPE